MKSLGAPLFAAILAMALLPACKDSAKSTSFSQGAKRKAVRKPGTFDRSKAADVASTSAPANAVTRGSFTVWTVPKDPGPGQDYQVFIEVKLPSSIANYQQSDLSGKVVGTDGYEQAFGAGEADNCGGESGNISTIDDESVSTEPYASTTTSGGPAGGYAPGSSTSADGLGLAARGKKKGLNLAGCDSGFEDFSFTPGRARLSVWVPGGDTKVRDTIDVTSTVLKESQKITIEF